jgi:hypothetical protein
LAERYVAAIFEAATFEVEILEVAMLAAAILERRQPLFELLKAPSLRAGA